MSMTHEEAEFIRKNYPTMSIRSIANHFGRSRTYVIDRLEQLGLRQYRPIRMTAGRKEFIHKHHRTMSVAEIVYRTGLPKDEVTAEIENVRALEEKERTPATPEDVYY